VTDPALLDQTTKVVEELIPQVFNEQFPCPEMSIRKKAKQVIWHLDCIFGDENEN
jgi:hypothetical protein